MDAGLTRRIETARRFNRFYTTQLGLLDEHLLRSEYSLAEARLLYELAQQERATATELGGRLGVDAGYLSRLVRRLESRGLLRRERAAADGRQKLLSLTRSGRKAFDQVNAASRDQLAALLGARPEPEQRRLVEAMETIEGVLGARSEADRSYVLRSPEPGDMGWIVYRHGVLYAREYGWNEHFEALVARIVADFVEHFDARRERCWIAERNGAAVGSVFLVRHPDEEGVAKLRLLLVEPEARGLGIGRRLVHECTRFARRAGYRKITLWTNSVLTSARQLYEHEGYQLVSQERHTRFGPELEGQTWDLEL